MTVPGGAILAGDFHSPLPVNEREILDLQDRR